MICTEVAPNSRISVSPRVTKSSQRRVTITTEAGGSAPPSRVRRVEIGPPDIAEDLSDVVEDLHGGRGIVHRGRKGPVGHVDHHPQCERRVLVEGALLVERDHPLEFRCGSRAGLTSVDEYQHLSCLHEVADRVR